MSMMMRPYFSAFDDFDPMEYALDTFPLASSGFSRLPSSFDPFGMSNMNRMNWPSLGYGGMGGRRRDNWPMALTTDRGMSQIVNDNNQFAVNVDVNQFKPEEITVKTSDDYVTIEGNHEEREDPHGYIKRHFVRRYMLPENVKAENVTSTLSADGVLTVKAPKQARAIEGGKNEKNVPIQHSPFPAVVTASQKQKGQQQGQGQGMTNGDQPMMEKGSQAGMKAGEKTVPMEQETKNK